MQAVAGKGENDSPGAPKYTLAMSFTGRELGFAPDGDGWRKTVGGTEMRYRRLRSAAEMPTVAAGDGPRPITGAIRGPTLAGSPEVAIRCPTSPVQGHLEVTSRYADDGDV